MAAASPLPISMSEYLHTSYEPDCDYVDGIVEARNVGAPNHATVQQALVAYLNRQEWGGRAKPEVRLQTSASHVRVADLAILSEEPKEDVIEDPPVAVTEILSPEGQIPCHAQRIEDYRRMGVENIWIINPAARKGFDCGSGTWSETQSFTVPDSPIHIDLRAFFAAMDKNGAR